MSLHRLDSKYSGRYDGVINFQVMDKIHKRTGLVLEGGAMRGMYYGCIDGEWGGV